MTHLPLPVLSDRRVLLRATQPRDLPAIDAGYRDPDVIRWIGPQERSAPEILARNADRWAHGSPTLSICELDGTCVGLVWLAVSETDRSTGSVGYWLLPAGRGRGLATSAVRLLSSWAVRNLGVANLRITTAPDNPRSQRVAERSGFQRLSASAGNTPADSDNGQVVFVLGHVNEGRGALRRYPSPAQLAWVERTVGSGARITGGRRMLGGITSSVYRLTLRLPVGNAMHVVLKRYTDPTWGDTPALVANEAAALTAVGATSVPAPRLLGSSPYGAETDGVPSVLMSREPGRVWLTPPDMDTWIRQLAALLPLIHTGTGVPATREPLDLETLRVPASAHRPDVWSAAKRLIVTEPLPLQTVRVHGDYQHFNVLWSRGRLSALVDWSASRIASPDIDVGRCRLNLAVLYSAETAERFRLAYESEAGRRVEPWWDIRQLLDYDDSWQDFIPVQVAGRASVDIRGMTARVEELLAGALARL